MNTLESTKTKTHQLKTARGRRYYDLLKSICQDIAEDFQKDVETLRAWRGGITPALAGVLAIRYDLNYKATFFALEEICRIPSGAYDRIVTDGGWKVGDILEAARQIEGCPVSCVSRYEEN